MKKTFKILNIITIILSLIFIVLNFTVLKKEDKKEEIEFNITNYYSKYVRAKNIKIYKKEESKFIEIGKTGENLVLILDGYEDKYFKIKDNDYYVYYEDVSKVKFYKENINDYYKNYIPFNENVVLDKAKLYNDNGLAYEINETLSLPIIIKEIDKYYVTYKDKLYYVNKSDVKETVYNLNTNEEKATKVAVLNYHFFYDKSKGEVCNEVICLEKTKFVEQLDYLKNNNYFTLKLSDLEMFIDGKINIPKNSVVITIDDGAMGVASIAKTLLEEYEFNGTLFLISAWFNKDDFISDYLQMHSHGHDLHNQGVCKEGAQGGAIQCLPRNVLLEDLNYSKNLLNGTTYFAYPFYEYNNYSISVLKEAGFTMAFVGGNQKAQVGTYKYTVPRYVMWYNDTIEDFINYLK